MCYLSPLILFITFIFFHWQDFTDTTKVVIDIAAQRHPILTVIENLPHDSMYLLPCPPLLGGVVVVRNAIIYADQSFRRIILPVNGWTPRISDVLTLSADPTGKLILEGSRSIFVDEKPSSLS